MDDATLAALRQALEASPENDALRVVVLRALVERGEEDEAGALLAGRDVPDATPADAVAVARALVAAGRAEEALPLVDGTAPDALWARARALEALGRREEGLACYRRAVTARPALEDPELERRLTGRSREVARPPGVDGPRLRLVEGGEKSDDVDAVLAPAETTVTFDDVGGLDDVKSLIRRKIITPFQKPSLFQRFKKKAGGGILLHGPPGCGKTLLARATAGECGAAFFNVAISDVLDMWVGESEAKLHALFEKARSAAPAVLFFDEVEALGGKRQFSRDTPLARLVSQFLSEMDGFHQRNAGVLVLGATNLPWALDSAFLRPGRFDRFMFVPPPDRAAREAILRLQLAGRPLAADVDPGPLARSSSGHSGADLQNVVETAADLAIEETLAGEDEVAIAQRHLLAALREVRPTTVDWLTTARNHARYANESGQYDDVLEFLRRHGRE